MKFLYISIFLLISSSAVFAQNAGKQTIDYYGLVSNEIDTNMSKMTSDLYYTQLREINSFTINDKRETPFLTDIPSSSVLDKENLSFYTIISKNDENKWTACLTLVDNNTNTIRTEAKEYDSFYKILMEPKATLQTSLKNLIENKTEETETSKNSNKNTAAENGSMITTEFLSGDWSGEDNIDKIIIMRGGRGFVTFSNGATMSIEIAGTKADDTTYITISGKGKPNASYFTEINRQAALKAAVTAEPIKWEFILLNDNTLSGLKHTLAEANGDIVPGTFDSVWKRKN
ncbi:MAG: hypothetical protein MJ162_01995 [Treponema sp.]|nr:hypothetical protein [Treponema sp.]